MSTYTAFAFKLLAPAALIAAAGFSAQAVDNTRYVSINGNNANACTLAAPCKSLQTGINATPEGGELRILDSGSYGTTANVRQSMTISGNGNTIFLDTEINIDRADVVVTLRDLTLNGQGTIANGISIAAAALVQIERCVIHNFRSRGIYAVATGSTLFIVDSVMRDNGAYGLFTSGDSLTVDNSHFDNNGLNGAAVASIHATIRRSTASGNGAEGISIFGGSTSIVSTKAAQNGTNGFRVSPGVMTIESSVAHGNGAAGLHVGGNNTDTARISNSTFTGNAIGIDNDNIVETRRNNIVRGNTTDLSGNALTFIGGT